MIGPIIQGFVNSLYNSKWGTPVFVGLKNYVKIFTGDIYVLATKNTLLFVIAVIPLLIGFGIWIAGSVFDKSRKYVSLVRSCLYIPVIASLVVMSVIWRFLLDSQSGLAKYFSMLRGVESFNLLADPTYTLYLLIFIVFSMGIGQSVMLYVADMLSIPMDLVEACKIDGGNRFHLFRYILIPLTQPTTVFIFITQTAGIIKTFVVIQLLTKGGPNYKTTTLMYLLYEEAFEKSNIGVASAIGVLLFAITLILIAFRFISIHRNKEEGLRNA
jgi:multiple sugar transport system permease protein